MTIRTSLFGGAALGALLALAIAPAADAKTKHHYRHVTAPAAGRVADVLARPGETMAAGAPGMQEATLFNIETYFGWTIPSDVFVSGI